MIRFRIWDYQTRAWKRNTDFAIDGLGDLWDVIAGRIAERDRYQIEFWSGLIDAEQKNIHDSDIVEIDGSRWLMHYNGRTGGFELGGLSESVRGKVAHAWHARQGKVVGDLHHDMELVG
jgi:hypothetical protein